MLKEFPKVGDKLRCIDGEEDYTTEGKVYTVIALDSDGDPYVEADDGEEYVIYSDYELSQFELFVEEPAGYIEVKQSTHNSEEATFEVVLVADEKGYASIKALVERSQTGVKRVVLERKIAELQAELDAL